jgi:hypothetical protein
MCTETDVRQRSEYRLTTYSNFTRASRSALPITLTDDSAMAAAPAAGASGD